MKLRILQILPEMNVGGVETGTVDLAKYLLAHGHVPVVVSNGGALVEVLEQAGVRHYSLPVHKKSLWTALRAVKALRKIILAERIQIVHARSRIPAWIAYWACRGTTAAFLTTCHGYYSNHFISRIMGWAKIVIVPSAVIGRHMIEDFHVPSERIRLIPRSVDLDRFAVEREPRKGQSVCRVVIVGRLTPLKGHVYFLKAMARVARSMPYVKVWVIGDAPAKKAEYRQELETLARRLGLNEQVEFLGNRRDVPQLLAQTDVCVLASTTPEAFGRVILEAQAVGVPVVATRVGGVVDIIEHERTGLLVPAKDPEAMASAVLRLLQDRPLAEGIVAAAKEKLLNQYTLEHMASRTIKVYRELLGSLNILVIKLSAIGDVVLITAALEALRKKFPQAKIACLVGTAARPVLQRCPYLDELIVIDLADQQKGWWSRLRFARQLARHHFDMIVDLQNSRISHLLCFLSFPRASYGYRNKKWGALLSHPVPRPNHDLPPVEHQFQVLAQVGVPVPEHPRLKLWLSERDRQAAQELLDAEWLGSARQIVGINIAASEKWLTKNWPLEHTARLCDILAAENIRVLFTGTQKDQDAARRLMTLTRTKPANLVGKTDILELAAVIERCAVFVTPDSAPLHIAAAMGTPVVAFFGPTSSRRHLPPVDRAVVLERNLPCQPCYSGRCRLQTQACLAEITPEEVAGQIRDLLGAGR